MVMAKIDLPRRLPGGCIPPRPPKPEPFPGGPIKIDPQVIDRLVFSGRDLDKDGQLSIDEFARNKDGSIDYDKVDKFKRYDVNADGKVDKKEWAAGRQWDRMLEKLKDFKMPKFEHIPFFGPKRPELWDAIPTPNRDAIAQASRPAADKT